MKKYLKQLKANKKGFTLIEMIVVIAIIGILAAILVPSMVGYLQTAKDSKNLANAKTVYTAAQAAVTSLEATTTPVANDTYTKTVTTTGNQSSESITAGINTNGDVANTLFGKIEKLIGATNYNKFTKIEVKVANGAVTEVTVIDASGEGKYPQ